MKQLVIIFGMVVLSSCGDKTAESEESKSNDKQEVKDIPNDQKITRHIQTDLNLTAANKYSVKKFKADLNGDDIEDVIITVNLLERALNEGIRTGRAEKMAEMGYMGYYNYLYFMDGLTKEISPGEVVASSPMFQLDVNFEKILGGPNKDFTVDYRVRNMQRRKFFTILGGRPVEVCQAIIFDGLGTPNTEAYHIEYEDGTVNDYNDIVEYEATLEDMEIINLDSSYYFIPTITSTGKEHRRWHYSPSQRKYFTVKN